MNIFYLDENIDNCVKYHCDKHVVKMILEYAQILSSVVRISGIDAGYKITHQKHPSVLWTLSSLDNWVYLKNLAIALNEEYKYRYKKITDHKSVETILNLPNPNIQNIGFTEPPKCMPDEYKVKSSVESYRNYYMGAKKDILAYKNREIPSWMFK